MLRYLLARWRCWRHGHVLDGKWTPVYSVLDNNLIAVTTHCTRCDIELWDIEAIGL